MTNLTCPIGSHPFGTTLSLTSLSPVARLLDGSIPAIVERVAFGALANIATFAGVLAAGCMLDIGARGCYVLRDSWNQYWQGLEAIEAAQNGNATFIHNLDHHAVMIDQTSYMVSAISDRHRGIAIINAVRNGHLEIVLSLLESGRISEKDRGQAIICGAERGDSRIVRELLIRGCPTALRDPQNGPEPGKISEKDRGLAVLATIKDLQTGTERDQRSHFEHEEIIRLLLDSGRISNEDRGLALEISAKLGKAEYVRLLLNGNLPGNGLISEETRGRAILLAVKGVHVEVVRLLLGSGRISEVDRGRAICMAAPDLCHFLFFR